MQEMTGSLHPISLNERCPTCRFILKPHFYLGRAEVSPHWLLYCPNLSCPDFGQARVRYTFEHSGGPTTKEASDQPEIPLPGINDQE